MSRRTECEGKRVYSDRAAALAARAGQAVLRPTLKAYHCRWCGSWHLGHAGIGTNGRSTTRRRRGRR